MPHLNGLRKIAASVKGVLFVAVMRFNWVRNKGRVVSGREICALIYKIPDVLVTKAKF